MVTNREIRWTAITLCLSSCMLQVFAQTSPSSENSLKAITVAFKLDPGPTYGGVRWISPATFNSSFQSDQGTFADVRVQGVNLDGRPTKIQAQWTAADPEMVAVSPLSSEVADQFRITVNRAGRTTLTFEAQGTTKQLLITAEAVNGVGLQLAISQ